MAMLTKTNASVSVFTRFDAALSSLHASYAQWQMYRNTLAELRGLSARELADLGLAPGGLKAIALEAVYGPRN